MCKDMNVHILRRSLLPATGRVVERPLDVGKSLKLPFPPIRASWSSSSINFITPIKCFHFLCFHFYLLLHHTLHIIKSLHSFYYFTSSPFHHKPHISITSGTCFDSRFFCLHTISAFHPRGLPTTAQAELPVVLYALFPLDGCRHLPHLSTHCPQTCVWGK